jgi:phosphoribosylglycinamide formyltransferase-1
VSGDHRLQIAVLISGSGTNLQAIIDAVDAGTLTVEIIAVISDRPDAPGLDRAKRANIPAITINYADYAERSSYDARLDSELKQLAPDLIVLAGYMRIIADATVNAFTGRMINVHPSLLPAYPGLHTYKRVLAAAEQHHGTTVHFVIPELDAGPPIIQYRVKIGVNETEQTLRERVQSGEYLIYPQAIQWFAENRLTFEKGQVIKDGQLCAAPEIIDAHE